MLDGDEAPDVGEKTITMEPSKLEYVLRDNGHPRQVVIESEVLALEGVQPLLDACVSCGATDRLVAIALHDGGVLCHDCRRGEPVSADALQALVLVFAGRVRYVLDTTSPATAGELEHLAGKMMEQHLERRLRTSSLLHQQIHPS